MNLVLMKPSPRREKYRNAQRKAILQAARQLFLRHGYEKFSMRKLAAKVGCVPGTLYLYFRDKEQLFDCLVEDSFRELSLAKHQLPSHLADDPVELLKRGARLYVDFGLHNPEAYKFAFVLQRPGPKNIWRPHGAFIALRSLVQRCVDEKRFRLVDVDLASQAVWAALHGVTSLLILRPSFPWAEPAQLIPQVIDNAVKGLLAVPPASEAHP